MSEGDYGKYTCEVSNRIQGLIYTRKFNMQLLKPRQPETPLQFSSDSQTSQSVSLVWYPGHNGGLPDQVFTLLYRIVSGDVNFTLWSNSISADDHEQGIHETIFGLQENTNYDILLFSMNSNPENNKSEPSSIQVFTEGKCYSINMQHGKTIIVVTNLNKKNILRVIKLIKRFYLTQKPLNLCIAVKIELIFMHFRQNVSYGLDDAFILDIQEHNDLSDSTFQLKNNFSEFIKLHVFFVVPLRYPCY